MGKHYSGYLSVNKSAGKRTGGGSSKGNGGGSGKPLGGGRDYYGGNKVSTARGNSGKAYHQHAEKNPRGNKETAERRSEQSSRSYYKVLNDPPRRATEKMPRAKLPLPPPPPPVARGCVELFPSGGPWMTRGTDEADASGSDAERDYGETDDDNSEHSSDEEDEEEEDARPVSYAQVGYVR